MPVDCGPPENPAVIPKTRVDADEASAAASGWGPSAGVLLLLATTVAVAMTNSGLGQAFSAFQEHKFGLTFNGVSFSLSFLHWINDGL